MSLFNSLYIIFQNMNEASSLLSATCNTFITTLEECVKIANAKFKPEMFQLSHPDPLVSPVSPSPVQMVGTSYCSSSNIACGFVFVFISKGRIWQWKGNSQQVEFFFFFFLTALIFSIGASHLVGSAGVKVPIPSLWRAVPFTPVFQENVIILCGCYDTKKAGENCSAW